MTDQQLLRLIHEQLNSLVDQSGRHGAHIETLQSELGRVRKSIHVMAEKLQASTALSARGQNGGSVSWPMLRMMAALALTSATLGAGLVMLVLELIQKGPP
jgi:hypothetical protein